MLCAIRDGFIDPDRAYDTFARIGVTDNSAIAYSSDGGSCIGPKTLGDIDLFLTRHLKGQEIFIPSPLTIDMQEKDGKIEITVEGDEEAILTDLVILYAEAEVGTKSVFRDWHKVCKVTGKEVKNGKFVYTHTPHCFGANAYAYAILNPLKYFACA